VRTADLGSSEYGPVQMGYENLDHGTWRLSGGQNLRSAKLQATSIKLDKLQALG